MFAGAPLPLLAAWLGLLAVLQQQEAAAVVSPTVYLPDSMRSEGRITLTYEQGEQKIGHELTFSEVIDAEAKSSRISIGYVSQKPKHYTTWSSTPTITTDAQGVCTKASNEDFVFLPELNWFVRMLWTDDEIRNFLVENPHLVGPSALVYMMLNLEGKKQGIMDRITTHRNVPCKVYKMNFDRPKSKAVEFTIYIPENAVFSDPKQPFFTARELAKDVQVDGVEFSSVSYTIDYFNIETIDYTDTHQLRQLEHDFNMPLASSCSRLLPKSKPEFGLDFRTFIMSYYQHSEQAYISLAYDHEHNYLRKEIFGQSVHVWDLNQDLMYHIDPHSSGKLRNSDASESLDAAPCAVLNVWDAKLGPAFRPFGAAQKSLDVGALLGAGELAYVGVGKVRELPCAIYETVLAEPPVVFASSLEARLAKLSKHNYIVQFYLLRTDQHKTYVSSDYSNLNYLSADTFWPLQVSLFRVELASGERLQLDQLDVVDFHWGLLGADRKPSELFLARECYEDETEQARVELALDFKFAADLDRKLLAHNKFQLEYDLSGELIDLFGAERTNVLDYQLSFRPHDLVVELTLADRADRRSLYYYGAGDLPEKYSYASNRLVLLGLSEERCVATASLVDEISFVVYCPSKESTGAESSCTAVYSELEPTIKSFSGEPTPASETLSCQTYRFVPATRLKGLLANLEARKAPLWDHKFRVSVNSPLTNQRVQFEGSVVGLDISHQIQLQTIYHYGFVLADDGVADEARPEAELAAAKPPPVRQLKSMTYRNVADCEKICNLDSSCRSYSYCQPLATKDKSGGGGGSCFLSRLELRESKVAEQLVAKQAVDETLEVSGADGLAYKLRLASACNIHERDYLTMFRPTEELIRLDQSLVGQFKREPDAFECARKAVQAEEAHKDHWASLFAYCADSNTCLFNENLFAPVATNGTRTAAQLPASDEDDASDPAEVQCTVYRRKYQNYFRVQPRVFKRQPLKQVELALATVEECARACWNQFGQVCGSFDFCSPGSCLINDASQLDHSIWDEFEVRNDCLHYERDLELDKLRVEHLIGKHGVLDNAGAGSAWSSAGKLLLNVLLFCCVSGSFAAGLVTGRQVNDRLEHLTIVRRSFSAGSSGLRRMSQALGFTRFYGATGDEQRRSFAQHGDLDGGPAGGSSDGNGNGAADDDLSTNHYYYGSAAIPMEEIKRNDTIEEETAAEMEQHEAKTEPRRQSADENLYESVGGPSIDLAVADQPQHQHQAQPAENLLDL